MAEENISYKVCTTLNYIEYFCILATATGCTSISAFVFFTGIPVGITNSTLGLKVCSTTAGIKKYKQIIKYDKIVLLAKSSVVRKLDSM